MSDPVFTTFAEIQAALDDFVKTNKVPIAQAPHGVFWRRGTTPDAQYQNFITGDAIPGFPILAKGSGATSNIILALTGQSPFNGSTFPQMPPVPPNVVLAASIATAIENWITNGAQQNGVAAGAAPAKEEASMSGPVFTTFAQVQAALDKFVKDHKVPVSGAPHHVFWRRGTTPADHYNNFVTGSAIPGFPIIKKGDGPNSNIILALSGKKPFDGSELKRMPTQPKNTFLDAATINAISAWITAGAKQ